MPEFSSRPDPSSPVAGNAGTPATNQSTEPGSTGTAAPVDASSQPRCDLPFAGNGAGRSITAVVAATPDGVIGDDQDMPWRLSSDLRRFKKTTMGGALIMGRKTFVSIGRVLPGRQTIVLTRQADWQFPGAQTASGEQEAIALAEERRIFVVGGGQIYRQWFPLCTDLWWTRVWAKVSGDTRIDLPLDEFELVSQSSFPVTEKDDYPTDWLRMRRRVQPVKRPNPQPSVDVP
ncbi:MAG: dihydrofolate reductase [Rhodopirellula sp. JB055]|uniref:dihydrofolate reductase n=1 Tax=Rhodopirellula sp. JB055 TaxID=3342846 RepID=UPI00370AA856